MSADCFVEQLHEQSIKKSYLHGIDTSRTFMSIDYFVEQLHVYEQSIKKILFCMEEAQIFL
jgi:hypothetical protein